MATSTAAEDGVTRAGGSGIKDGKRTGKYVVYGGNSEKQGEERMGEYGAVESLEGRALGFSLCGPAFFDYLAGAA